MKSEPTQLPTEERIRLARQAYRDYHVRCFWWMREDLEIGETDLPVVARYLALHGGREGWNLAARICPSHRSR